MSKTAFLFAGQGSQQTGMGEALYQSFPEFRAVFEGAELDFDLKETCFVNPDNRLKQTRYTQPCLVAFACGVTEILINRGIVPDVVCGLSLGEYSALYAAGVWNLADVLRIATIRGAAMEQASEGVESAMTAVMSLNLDGVEACCAEASGAGVVSVCNLNCPGQIVIGGEKPAVKEAARLAKARGARRCVSLPVSGPFHTAFMAPAADALRALFETVAFAPPRCEVLYNVLGGPNEDAEPIADLLVRQVKSPVRMQACIERLFGLGIDTFVEIGPGNALQGFVNKTADYLDIDRESFRVLSINTPEDVACATNLLS